MSQKAILKEHNYKIVRGGFIWIRDTLILSYSTLTVDNTLPCILYSNRLAQPQAPYSILTVDNTLPCIL